MLKSGGWDNKGAFSTPLLHGHYWLCCTGKSDCAVDSLARRSGSNCAPTSGSGDQRN